MQLTANDVANRLHLLVYMTDVVEMTWDLAKQVLHHKSKRTKLALCCKDSFSSVQQRLHK